MSPLASLEATREEVLALAGPLAPVEIPLGDALGAVLAAEVTAAEDVPPFANTAMDGYAVRAADTAGAAPDAPARLRVVGELPAGRAPSVAVGAGEAIRIMTGAPMPPGADAVVMVERTRPDGDDGVAVEVEARTGDHVRPAAGDLHTGQRVFAAGTRLGAAHLGVLASVGAATVCVHPRPRVGVLSTGDELVAAGALAPGQIRDSNRPMLLGLVREAGLDPIDLGMVGDDEARITAMLDDAFTTCDAVLTSGGVSVGDYDYVKAAIDALARADTAGASRFEWRQVAIKPAKPLAFGAVRGTPVFGLPGNPVSSLVSFELFARPVLLQLAGAPQRFRPEVTARAEHEFARKPDGKVHLDRVRVTWRDDGYVAASTGGQASNMLAATALANGLAMIPDGDGVAVGAPITVMLLDAPPDH
jgi:molybdopterin molybdotransferase